MLSVREKNWGESPAASHRRRYFERELSVLMAPIDLAARVLGSLGEPPYVLYEREGEWGLALGVAYEVVVDTEGVWRVERGIRERQAGRGPLECVQAALESIPLEGWRAYGTAAFEFAYLLHDLEPHSGTEPVLQLMIPRLELRIRRGEVLIRALSFEELEAAHASVMNLCSPTQEPRSSSSYADAASAARGIRNSTGTLDAEINFIDAGAPRYRELVALATRDIRQHKFQKVVASRLVPVPTPVDFLATYVAGRKNNTPARSFLIDRGTHKMAGFSPETVLEVSASGVVSTQPLAGTRALGPDARENARLREDLLRDSKELAEHAVSVKLAFEELDRVCRPGSVRVTDFMNVSARGTVQHLASRLEGVLAGGKTAWSAFGVLFPAVTASGVPKRAALEWIRQHEAEQRSLYSGAVLTLDDGGAMDAALVLRTVFQSGSDVWLRAGAGIVAQSTPERELEETCEKLRSVAQNLVSSGMAGREPGLQGGSSDE